METTQNSTEHRPALTITGFTLTGVGKDNAETAIGGERMTLVAGEYAVVRVNDAALLRDTWTWLLGSWLPTSGRREKNAPEFERFASISETGTPIGLVEI